MERGVAQLAGLFVLFVVAFAVAPGLSPVAADGGPCLQEASGLSGVCEADDVDISELWNLPHDVVHTCTAGTMVELDLRAKLVSQANERYDIGMFVALDGLSALSGICRHDYLHPVVAGGTCSVSGAACLSKADCPGRQTCNLAYNPLSGIGPYYDAEEDKDSYDTCGDVEKGVPTYYDLLDIEVPCIDSNGDGKLDIGTCVSWDNNQNTHCIDVTSAIPGTTTKCRCGKVTVGNVTVLPGLIAVEKTGPKCVKAEGDLAEYTIRVTNTSSPTVSLEIVSIIDDLFGDVTKISDCTCGAGLPAAGGSLVCTFEAPVIIPEGENKMIDTVLVTARDPQQNLLYASDSASVGICKKPPDTGVTLPAPLLVGGLGGVGLALIVLGILVQARMRKGD